MKTRNTQVFVAPRDEAVDLPVEPSPWHDGRWVRLPHEHWALILAFAAGVDPRGAAALERLGNVGAQPAATQAAVELRAAVSLLRRLAGLLPSAPRLIDAPREGIPEDLPNEAHAQMCEAVAAVMAAGVETGRPIRSWVE